MDQKKKLYWTLFKSTFLLSAFTLGGGYVIVPLMRKRFVDELGWIDEEEMLNFIAMAQSSPGPIAVNTSLLVGYRMAGVPGALVTVAGTFTPPLLIISVVAFFYDSFRDNAVVEAVMKGMQAGVAAVIADAVWGMGSKVLKERDMVSVAVMIGAFIVTYFTSVNVMFLILTCGFLGALRVLAARKRKGDSL